jgi:Flp pilus assembly protein TadD
MKRSLGWVALGITALAALIALGLVGGPWHAHSLAEQGRALVAEGQYLSAVRVLSEAVALAPGNASAHYYLGLAYAGIGLCGAAWIHLQEAMRLVPTYTHSAERLGPACRATAVRPDVLGQFDHAVHRDR